MIKFVCKNLLFCKEKLSGYDGIYKSKLPNVEL